MGGNIIGGELQGGGSAMVSLAKSGSDLGVGISMVSGPAGTLSRLEAGAIDVAKQQGASSVTFTGKMASTAMGRLLGKNGFTQVVKDGVKTNDWTKTVQGQMKVELTMDAQSRERARIKRLLQRLDEDETRWKGPQVAVSEMSEDEVAMALKLIKEEKAKLATRLAQLED